MKDLTLPALLVAMFVLFSCNEKDAPNPLAPLTETLNQELQPLGVNPLQWPDEDLRFLDALASHKIVGLGEATHGSAEFFKAKHRIFEYLVENHGFKIFAIEADFGESLFINEAVLNSDRVAIDRVMKEKMLFWTWRTREVREFLYWMCDYNLGKAPEKKVQYWGVDCQYNIYHPNLLKERLEALSVPFMSSASLILSEANVASGEQFSFYEQNAFDVYMKKVNALKDSIVKYESFIIAKTSQKHYDLTLKLADQIQYASDVIYYTAKKTATKNYRDEYMANNTRWLHEYFDEARVALWAHNFHVADFEAAGSMGHHLKADFPGDYASLGFLFSKGSFSAVTQTGATWQGLETQTLESNPKTGSLNDVMSRANVDVFHVQLSDLQKHEAWQQTFNKGIDHFHVGSVWNNQPLNYYFPFDPAFYDVLIYFDRTIGSVQYQ
jgi:erythromycin esterase